MPTPSRTSLKLDVNTKKRVKRLALARRPSPHWVTREAIAEYVEREENRQQLRQDALAVWDHHQTTGLHVIAEEGDAWLARLEAGKSDTPPECRAQSGLSLLLLEVVRLHAFLAPKSRDAAGGAVKAIGPGLKGAGQAFGDGPPHRGISSGASRAGD
jgi:predicted transcriptional regulator